MMTNSTSPTTSALSRIKYLPNAAVTRPWLASPMQEIVPGLIAKFECHNPGGSHKVRAARYIIERAVRNGDIIAGRTTVIEKTGGNFGFGLTAACYSMGVDVELAVGLSFSAIKRQYLERCGARLIGLDMLHAGATPREVVEWHLAHAQELGKHYFFTDQFNNPASVEAHEMETGPEIVAQLKAAWPEVRRLTFVACAGTGASLTGITRCLQTHGYDTRTILVEPAGCDSSIGQFVSHRLEGMSVGVKPPFLDWSLVGGREEVSQEQMTAVQTRFAESHGYFVGNTSAACLAVALALCPTSGPEHKVLSLVYDHSLWYPAVAQAAA